MKTSVSKILLFTLTACPMGKSMGTVLKEVKNVRPNLQVEPVYVEIDSETTNRFRVQTNPTSVFLDSDGEELYRFEGFKDTPEVLDLIGKAENGSLSKAEVVGEVAAASEKYTIYLVRNGELLPYEAMYHNPTSVRAPRITALRLQVELQPEGFVNPFFPGTRLLAVNFKDKWGKVTISEEQHKDLMDPNQIHLQMQALEKALSHFGIETVELERQ